MRFISMPGTAPVQHSSTPPMQLPSLLLFRQLLFTKSFHHKGEEGFMRLAKMTRLQDTILGRLQHLQVLL